jgi:alcohol dehydrogenase class IV
MANFGVLRPPQTILFGKGQRGALGVAAKSLGRRAIVCTDSRLSAERVFVAMMDDLKANGVTVQIYDRTVAELPLSCLDDCVKSATPFAPDVVIGIGGGSCMDLAKAAAIMLTHGGHIREYYGEFKVPGPIRPLVLLPTTSGTGSEVSPVAVLSDPGLAMKAGIASPHIVAHTAICDPELTYSCPASLTATSGCDALTHAVEAFTALRRPATPELSHQHVFVGKNVFSDHHALLAIERISRSLANACRQGDDEAAREDLMLGALSAGLAFSTAGTAAAHAIQYPVGAITHTAHGSGVALVLPYVMDFNRAACVADFAQIAVAMGAPRAGQSEERLSFEAIRRVASLLAEVGLPRTLAELGLPADKLEWVAEQAFTIQRLVKNNPMPVDVGKLGMIVKAAFAGILTSEVA